VADRRAPTPSAAAEIVAESEEGLKYFIEQLRQDLFQTINFQLLNLRSEIQELAFSPVFTEFPNKLKDWQYEIEDLQSEMKTALSEKLKTKNQRLETLTKRLSPLNLASKLNSQKTQFALLNQRQISSVKDILDEKDESLKIKMASLDALSPLSVLNRGFAIAENEKGEILRDSSQVKANDNVKIRLAKGRIEAKVLESLE